MSDTKVIPQWAKEKAALLANAEVGSSYHYTPGMAGQAGARAFTALAAHIAEYEKEPVDPDLIVARQAVANRMSLPGNVNAVLKGDWDKQSAIQNTLAGIKLYKETHKQCSC